MKKLRKISLLQIAVVAVICVSVGLLIIACYAEVIKPTKGVVVAKRYEPARQYVTYYNVTNSNGISTSIPIIKTEPEKYCIVIKGINKKGKETEWTYTVSPSEYEALEIGEYYIHRKD